MLRRLPLFLALMFFAALLEAGAGEEGPGGRWATGAQVRVECRDWHTGDWGHGPLCKETGKELEFSFGIDNFLYCGLEIADESAFRDMVQIVKLEKNWQCRVPMTPSGKEGKELYVPFAIPIWGVVEGDHFHIDNHVNFIFHVDDGKIIAAAAYPVRDRFQFGKAGSLISMHGPVRWFQKQGFTSFSGQPLGAVHDGEGRVAVALVSGILSSLLTLLFFVLLYQRKLKPRIIRKCMKKE